MNWKIGQKLVCVNDRWLNTAFGGKVKKGDIVTYAGDAPDSSHFITAEEGDVWYYDKSKFQPIITRKDAKQNLISQFIEVVESPDCPITTPEPSNA